MTNPKSVGRLPLIFVQLIARIVRAHHVPVLLHEQHSRTRLGSWRCDARNARLQRSDPECIASRVLVDRLPGLAAIIGTERARRGDRDEDPIRIAGIKNDGVQAHAAGARLPLRTGAMAAQSGEFAPVLAAIGGAEQIAASSTPA